MLRSAEPNVLALRLAAAGRWVRRSLRSLFPPIAWRRLRFRGGWFALPIYLLMMSVYPLSLQQADWVVTQEQFTWIVFSAIVLAVLVGNGTMATRRAMILGGFVGTVAIVLATAFASDIGPFRERVVHLAVNVNNWITQVLAGEAATDPTVFVLFLGATVWTSAYVGTFALSRSLRPWDAILFMGFCLVVNVSMALTNLIADLVVFSLSALVLLVRLHIVALQERWSRNNIIPSGEMDWRLLRGGLTWTMVLVIMSLVTPRVGAAEVLNRAYSVFETPYHSVEAEWQRFFAGVSGPSRLRGVSFTDAIRLGQSPNLADRVVMTVDAQQGRFWRAIAYDFYTGNGWRTTETDKVDRVAPAVLGREKFDATFEMLVPQQNLLFGANEPVKVTVPIQFQTGADRTYSTSLRAIRGGQSALNYTVTSYVSVADKAALRRASNVYPDYIRQKYLQLPSTLPQRVRDLAHQVAGEQSDPYDKAEVVESFLRTTYRYAPTVRAPPPGRDPVDFFLYDLKEDFCEYFASAMVVMLRELGVPARVVEGYTAGTLDPASGKFVVKELDAHAWVEVYFPLYGWIEFEPTPSQAPIFRVDSEAIGGGSAGGGEDNPDGTSAIDREDKDLLADNAPDEGQNFGDSVASAVQNFDPRPIAVLIGALLLLLLLAFARFQFRFRGQPSVDSAWGKARLLASYAGFAADPSQTTYEYATMLGEAVPDAKSPIQDIAEARVHDRYTPSGASDEDVERAVSGWRKLARTLVGMLPARVVSGIARIWR
ncbi:MAG TPA: transglutaminaseTgpA domain-containing protein [Candidatus Limnocylindria bacterium]|jgi:transglutaminase-like putative cysteine protease|nr:transglutaminaseTgpA domain-containing protein [Candidatus Limnocylindria bacterium]